MSPDELAKVALVAVIVAAGVWLVVDAYRHETAHRRRRTRPRPPMGPGSAAAIDIEPGPGFVPPVMALDAFPSYTAATGDRLESRSRLTQDCPELAHEHRWSHIAHTGRGDTIAYLATSTGQVILSEEALAMILDRAGFERVT